jgi:glycerol kinase
MEQDSGIALQELRVDGGASRNALAMQFQADILGVPVVRPQVTETTALGAAYLAGLQCGFWSGIDEVTRHWREEARFTPRMRSERRETLLTDWHRAVQCARGWARP